MADGRSSEGNAKQTTTLSETRGRFHPGKGTTVPKQPGQPTGNAIIKPYAAKE